MIGKLDEEYLELDEEDQEEVEININIDKYSFNRAFNKVVRNFDDYMNSKETWFSKKYPNNKNNLVDV